MESIHAEVPNNVDIETSHEVIDRSNGMRWRNWGIFLSYIWIRSRQRIRKCFQIREDAYQVMKETDPACSLHDFRVVHGKNRINLIFDMVVPREYGEEKRTM